MRQQRFQKREYREYQPRECFFCRRKIKEIDYTDAKLLGRYLSPWAKIKPNYYTGTCSKHQRKLTQAIKRARFLALMPYVSR